MILEISVLARSQMYVRVCARSMCPYRRACVCLMRSPKRPRLLECLQWKLGRTNCARELLIATTPGKKPSQSVAVLFKGGFFTKQIEEPLQMLSATAQEAPRCNHDSRNLTRFCVRRGTILRADASARKMITAALALPIPNRGPPAFRIAIPFQTEAPTTAAAAAACFNGGAH